MKYVSKYVLLDFLENHIEILHAFKFHPKEYRRVILSMITERHDMLNFDEFDVALILLRYYCQRVRNGHIQWLW